MKAVKKWLDRTLVFATALVMGMLVGGRALAGGDPFHSQEAK